MPPTHNPRRSQRIAADDSSSSTSTMASASARAAWLTLDLSVAVPQAPSSCSGFLASTAEGPLLTSRQSFGRSIFGIGTLMMRRHSGLVHGAFLPPMSASNFRRVSQNSQLNSMAGAGAEGGAAPSVRPLVLPLALPSDLPSVCGVGVTG